MSREDVRDNIFNQMSEVLANNKIDYVKWDFNRNLTEAGSALLPANRQKEIMHRFVLGTYDLMNRFVTAFPHILFENCSGGGGRFDVGMLYYSPQIWCSDNTDPIERLTIQFGTSMCYPVSTFGAHVSANKRASIQTRANVAMCGTFGYELDATKLKKKEIKACKKMSALYHKYYDLNFFGDYYRLANPFEQVNLVAWETVAKDKSEALVTVITVNLTVNGPQEYIKCKGLDRDRYYRVENSFDPQGGSGSQNGSDVLVATGMALMHAGIPIPREIPEYTAFLYHLTAI
jgi:alpha-galactosidase